MSGLGFLAESSLMPSKAVPILGVDAGSMVDLKALVYQQEQQLRDRQGSGDSDKVQRKFGKRAASEESAGPHDRRFGKRVKEGDRNRGVGERNRADKEARDETQKSHSKSHDALVAKAELYDKIVNGQGQGAGKAFLVDFQGKSGGDRLLEAEGGGEGGWREEEDSPEVEITDSFGRTRLVERGGVEHIAHMQGRTVSGSSLHGQEQKKALQRQALWQTQQAEEDDADRRAGSGVSSNTGGGHGDREMMSQDMRRDEERRQWEAEARRDAAGEGGASRPAPAAVLSQWQKGLNGSEKSFLQQINEQTREGRKGHERKLDRKDERRRMLQEKQQQRLLKLAAKKAREKGGRGAGAGGGGGGSAAGSAGHGAPAPASAAADASAFLSSLSGV